MPAVATAPTIRREISDDHICVLTFDRPDSGANIFDAATLDELSEHLDAVEKDPSLRGLIIASAKKSIFVAGADLKTLLQGAQTGEMRGFIERGQQVFNRLTDLKIPTVAAIHGASAGGGYEIALPDYLLDRAREKLRAGKRKLEGGAPSTAGSQELALAKQSGNPALARAYEIINKTLSISSDESLRLELTGIVELGKTESTQNLIRNFFLAEKYKKGK